MKSIFGVQEVIGMVSNDYEDIVTNPINAQRIIVKYLEKKKYYNILFYIQQNLDSHHFEKIIKVTRWNEVWNIQKKYHDGGENVKQMTLQSLRGEYDLMHME